MLNAALLAGLNHLVQGSGWASTRLARFTGRLARFELPPFHLELRVAPDGLFESPPEQAAPDVVISLPPETPFLLPQGMDKVMSLAHVAGNAEFATELSFIFRRLNWDVEEDLSAVVGDITAHRLARGANHLVSWQKQTATRFAENLAEYLAHENPVLVPGGELVALRDDIGRFNAELADVEARMAKLAS